jgi:hypothetical protein
VPFENIAAFKQLHNVLMSDAKSQIHQKQPARDLLGFSNLVSVSSIILKSIKDNNERHNITELYKAQLRGLFAISEDNP